MSRQSLKILIVDNLLEDRAKLRGFLESDETGDYQVLEAETAANAARTGAAENPDCVLLGQNLLMNLPDISGGRSPRFPVIILLETDDEAVALKAAEEGAQDYLVKSNLTAAALSRSVRDAISAFRLRRQNEEISKRYRLFAETSRDIMLFFRTDGRIIEANRAALDAHGFTREEILTKTFYDIRVEESWAQIPEQMRQAEKGAFQFETVHRRRDGSTFPVEASWSVAEIEGERVILSIIRDITERRENELKLHESRIQTHLALEAANTIAFTWDLTTDVVQRLHSSVEALPKTQNDTLTNVAAQIFEPDRQRFLENLQTAIAHPREIYRAEYRLPTPDGKLAWFSEVGRFETNEAGEAVRLTGISTEITERKIAEEQLRASEARLHLGVKVADFAICQIDYATGTTHLSREAARLYDLGSEEMSVPRELVHATFHPDDAPQLAKLIKQAMLPDGDGWFALEHRIVRRDGAVRWLNVRKQIFFDHDADPPRPTIGILAAQDITTRREGEEKIRRSEERYRALIRASAQVEWIAAADGAFIERQPTWEGFTGQTFEEYSGSGWLSAIHPDDREATRAAWQTAVAEKRVYEIENRMRRRDGAYRWVSVRAVPILDGRGEVREWIGTNTDISERKELEQKIREQFEELENIYRTAPIGLGLIDREFRFLRINERLAEINGVASEEHLGRSVREIVPDLADQAEAILRRVFETGEPVLHVEIEGETAARQGVKRIWDESWYPIKAETGETVCVSIFVEEITERNEAEKALREQQRFTQSIVEAAPSLTYIFDVENSVNEFISPQSLDMLGYTTDEIAGFGAELLPSLLHPEDAVAATARFEKLLADRSDEIFELEYRMRHKSGAYIWIFDRARVFRRGEDGAPVQILGVATDITSRKRHEQNTGFLADLQAEFARLSTEREIIEMVGSRVADYLNLSQCIFVEIDETLSEAKVFYDSRGAVEKNLVGVYALADFHSQAEREALFAGAAVVIGDVRDAADAAQAAGFEALGIRALTTVSYLSGGNWRLALSAQSGAPRRWREDETQLLQEIAARVYLRLERARAEERLRYQLQLTQNITETAAVSIFVSDREGRTTFLNPEAEKTFGYTLDDLRGKILHDVIHYQHADGTPFPMSECPLGTVYLDGRAVRDFESTFFRRDGSPVSVICSNTPIIENGAVTGEVMALLDITERKIDELNARLLLRVGELIRESDEPDEIFEGVARLVGERLAAARCVFNEIDLEKDEVRVRAEYASDGKPFYPVTVSAAGYSAITRSELEKGGTVVVADAQTDERTAAWFEKSYKPEGIGAYIACSLMRENVWRGTITVIAAQKREWREWEIGLVQTAAERAWLAAEKLRSEKKVRESEERFLLLTENLDSVFWIFDWQEKRAEYVSPAFNRLYGDEYADSLAVEFKNWTDIIYEEDRERAASDFFGIETTGKYESTYRIVMPDGAIRWRHAKGSPIRDESGAVLRVVGVTEDITDRRLTENQILESEKRLRLATDVAEMFSWENDLISQKIKWSDNAAKIIGCAPEELPTEIKDSLFFVAPEEHARLNETFEQVLAGGKTNYISEFRGKNGAYWQAHSSIIRDERGAAVKVVGVTQNITARKRAERRIETANYRFRVAEEAAKGFNYEWNVKTGEVTRSESIERVLGYAREELETTWQAWFDLVHPDDISVKTEAEALAMVSKLTEESFSGEYRVRHRAGHYVWLMERGLVIRDRWGNIERVIGQTMDITSQKETQEKLLAAERRAVSDYRALLARIAPLAQTLGTARELTTIYRALLDFIRLEIPCEGFLVSFYDAENQLKLVKYVWSEGSEHDARAMKPIALFKTNGVNSRAIRESKSIISTRDLEKMNGNFQVISERDQPRVESLVTPMIVMGRVIGTLEVQNHTEKYGQEHVVSLEMAASLAAVAIENVRLMNVESEARAAAEEANRAKDEFLAMLSHELRSPLNAMFGWTQILQTTKPNAEQTEKAVEVIARNVRLQKTLIEDLLDVSRIISGKMQLENENVSLVSIVQAAVDAARPAAEKQDISIELEVKAAADEVHGDKHRLQQIVGNLLTNAVKFTPNGGLIKILLETTGEKVCLTVADNGIGIAPELLPLIFDRFRQADGGYKRKYGGLGLGLTIVKHLTELHGGSVTAFSEGENRGSRFIVELPLVQRKFSLADDFSARSSPAMLSQNLKSLDGARILTVDDDRDVLDLIGFVLREEGARVTCCTSVREALENLQNGDEYDLLISDLGMAEMDGFDLIRTLREKEKGGTRSLPAVALTGFVSAQDRRRVFDAGFQTHLSKPVDLNKLLTVAVGLIKNSPVIRE